MRRPGLELGCCATEAEEEKEEENTVPWPAVFNILMKVRIP
jgi:hypothetical protein